MLPCAIRAGNKKLKDNTKAEYFKSEFEAFLTINKTKGSVIIE